MPLGAVEASIAALKAQQIDAVVLSTEAGFALEERHEGRMLVSMDHYAPHFITHVVFAPRTSSRTKPQVVERFLKGFFAVDRLYENASRRDLGAGGDGAATESQRRREGLRFRDRRCSPPTAASIRRRSPR